MKIFHIHPSAIMANKFVVPLVNYEKKIGFKSELIVFKNDCLKTKYISYNLSLISFNLLIECIKFYFFLKKNKPDIIICHNSLQALIPLIISNLINIKKKVYYNHGIPFLGYKGILRYLFISVEKLNSYNADITLTVSFSMKKYLDKFKNKTIVINNGSACGIDLKRKRNKTKKENKKIVITYVGRFKKRKGSEILFNIIKYFDKRMDLEFKICGCTNEEFYKKFKCKFKNVNCLGFIDNVEDILKETDIFILPSFHEGLSYSLMEAMSYGIFCIANNIPGINSLIIHNFSGILVNQNNAQRYIDIIEEISVKRDLLDKFKSNAKEIIKKFDRKIFLREYSNFLYILQREIECL